MLQTITVITWRYVWEFNVNISLCQTVFSDIAAQCTICWQWQTLELLAIYRTKGLDQLCSWTPREEGEDGGWHEVVLVFGGVGMSVWCHLIEHQACVHRGCVWVEERKQHNSEREKGRRWMERADVMQPLAAITQVLCSRLTVCCMTAFQMYCTPWQLQQNEDTFTT